MDDVSDVEAENAGTNSHSLKISKGNYNISDINFLEKFDAIEHDISTASVISIDSEFSGLTFGSKFKNSLFDAGPERYEKLRNNVDRFILIQIGLTTFHFCREDNRYDAHMYNFFIFPRSVGSIDRRFSCQASSLEFLSGCSFDFNKFIYEGIPYLNEEQERILSKELLNEKMLQNTERNIPLDDERLLQKLVSQVSVWALCAKYEEEMVLEDKALAKNEILIYLIQKEIRKRFDNLWTTKSIHKITIKKIDEKEKTRLDKENGGSLEKDVIDYYLGFTRIIRLLASSKKPIIGHNLLIDLMILYNQFFQPLPHNYKLFKKKIHSLFPKIFDTKYISYELRRVLKKEDSWASNAVLDLYKYFSEGKGQNSTLYRPEVRLWTQLVDELSPDILLHEAGWDSFICGYCFIQMGHYFACYNYGLDGYERPLTSTEHINSVTPFVNKINVIRASIPHINLDGDDPPSSRPKNLLIKTKNGSSIDTSEITELLAKYCAIDVKNFNHRSALVAVPSFSSARQILKEFRNHKKYHITLYHPIRDSLMIRLVLWGGLILSGGLCTSALIMKMLKK